VKFKRSKKHQKNAVLGTPDKLAIKKKKFDLLNTRSVGTFEKKIFLKFRLERSCGLSAAPDCTGYYWSGTSTDTNRFRLVQTGTDRHQLALTGLELTGPDWTGTRPAPTGPGCFMTYLILILY
jgi:hypothetical protein